MSLAAVALTVVITPMRVKITLRSAGAEPLLLMRCGRTMMAHTTFMFAKGTMTCMMAEHTSRRLQH